MRLRLAHSLEYILETIGGRVSFDAAALGAFLARLRAAPVTPLAFGAYADLVVALEAGELARAEQLLQELAATPPTDGTLRVLALADPGTDAAADRYRRLIDTDPAAPVHLAAPPPALAEAARGLIAQAFTLLERGHPDLAAELRALLREIVLAAGAGAAGEQVFDGASSFLLWGGIVLNAQTHATPLDMVQALVHESGHNLLFGLCANGPLVGNDSHARYPSPLRHDARPMDGIVHAAYVSARMHHALARLLAAGVLDAAAAASAQGALAGHAASFAAGMQTIRAHARLTALGEAVLAGAADAMPR